MKKQLSVVLALLFLTASGVAVAQGPVVEPMKRKLEDAGCAFSFRNKPEHLIFYSSLDGTWMKIDGKEIQLERVSPPPIGTEKLTRYKAKHISVTLIYGPTDKTKKTEEHGVLPKGSITVVKNGKKTIIPVIGWCGC